MRRGWSEVGTHKLNSSIWKSQIMLPFQISVTLTFLCKGFCMLTKYFQCLRHKSGLTQVCVLFKAEFPSLLFRSNASLD